MSSPRKINFSLYSFALRHIVPRWKRQNYIYIFPGIMKNFFTSSCGDEKRKKLIFKELRSFSLDGLFISGERATNKFSSAMWVGVKERELDCDCQH